MTKTITFNELRDIKDRLPDGTIHRIAAELGLSVETVRNYFGGENYKEGKSCGVHIESSPNGRSRSEERRVGKECRSRWSPYH